MEKYNDMQAIITDIYALLTENNFLGAENIARDYICRILDKLMNA